MESEKTQVVPERRIGPLFEPRFYKDVKDPNPVFDGALWHVFGTGGKYEGGLEVMHYTAPHIEGSWREGDPVVLKGVAGEGVCAPGVIFDVTEKRFHMFVHTDFLKTGSTIEHLVSSDGAFFERRGTALRSVADSGEACLYDVHPAVIAGEKYLVYAGTPRIVDHGTHFVSRPDVYLAKSESGTWIGPWKRRGKILSHADIAWHHNQHDHPEYEWGIEGPQLIPLPNGHVLLNATCFLPHGEYGTKQRVFFALAPRPEGPYVSLGPVLSPHMPWENGENGHAAGIVMGDMLHLFYQARPKDAMRPSDNLWRCALAVFPIAALTPQL